MDKTLEKKNFRSWTQWTVGFLSSWLRYVKLYFDALFLLMCQKVNLWKIPNPEI